MAVSTDHSSPSSNVGLAVQNVPATDGTVGERSARDLDATARVLEHWLAARMPMASHISVSNLSWPQGAGMSNETILCTARWNSDGRGQEHGLVVRLAPSVAQFFMDADLFQQFSLLKTLHDNGHVKVAEPLWFEADEAILGLPFFVMRRLVGKVPVSFPSYNKSGFLFDATPAERRTLWQSAMAELCRIATVPTEAVSAVLARPEKGDTGFDQHVAYWKDARIWSAPDPAPVLLAAEEWFEKNRPTNRPPGLAWGDARMGNMMFGADFRLTGVMDWEQASIGGAMFDLGWWLSFDKLHSVDQGLARLDGLGGRHETLSFWTGHTGLSAADLEWYEAFAGYTLGVLVSRRYAEPRSERPGHNRNNNLYTRHMCEITGFSMPQDMILNAQ